jgi:hypothetical protein
MLKIRVEQMRALGLVSAGAFESRLLERCREYAPRLAALRGDSALRRTVRLGVDRASEHGFDLRGPVRFWVETMLACGSGWHNAPQLARVTRALERRELQQSFRADLVYEALLAHLARTDGVDKCHARDALQRILAIDWAAALAPAPNPRQRALSMMQSLHPAKAETIGPAALEVLVTRAGEHCPRLAIDPGEGQVLLAGLMFGFGHEVLADPMYPWVAATLQPGRGSSARRCRALARKTRLYVRAVLEHWSA